MSCSAAPSSSSSRPPLPASSDHASISASSSAHTAAAAAGAAAGAAAVASTSASYATPTKRATISDARSGKVRPTGSSPAYSSRRHSLYGIEDRVVIDPGSRIWKVGFSGEPDPRSVFYAQDDPDLQGSEMYGLDLGQVYGSFASRSEGRRLVAAWTLRNLRQVFHKHLLTDPKTRKVIIIESTFLPTFLKEDLARVLFDNLNVPSISFTSSALLSLTAAGRVTGLVVDVGWLETTVTPVAYSRPLYHLAQSTPLAGKALHSRLRDLLYFSTFTPTSTSSQRTCTPAHILTDRLIERILTEGCFVGGVFIPTDSHIETTELSSFSSSSSSSYALPDQVEGLEIEAVVEDNKRKRELIDSLRRKYAGSTTVRDMEFKVEDGVVVVPGWIRERAAEVLFDGSDTDVPSVTQLILSTLLKLPIDLRSALASSILIVGGTASLPNFIPRLRISLLQSLLPPSELSPTSLISINSDSLSISKKNRSVRIKEPFAALYGLASRLAILNDPSPPGGSEGGKSPRWGTALMSWVGGSLAGALKISGPEITREEYDARVSDVLAKSEMYLAQLSQMEKDEAYIRASLGVELEGLLPGQALGTGAVRAGGTGGVEEGMSVGGGMVGRKRGWGECRVLTDWSTGVRVG